jgi:hypothetical protein
MGQGDPVGKRKGSMTVAPATSNQQGKQVMSNSPSAPNYSQGATSGLPIIETQSWHSPEFVRVVCDEDQVA